LLCPTALLGTLFPSNAAAITSAGRSICTPSAYVYASRGEYAGGSLLVNGLAGSSLSADVGVTTGLPVGVVVLLSNALALALPVLLDLRWCPEGRA